MSNENDVVVKIVADASNLQHGMEAASKAVESSIERMKTGLEGLAGIGEHLRGVLLGLGAVLAGGALFKESLAATNEWNSEVTKLSKSLGISTQEASTWAVALDHIGVSSETVTGASLMMSRMMLTNADAFKKVGIETKDATTGAFRPANEVMMESIEKLKGMHNVVQQNQAGMKLFGRGWGEIKPLMKLTQDQMEEAKATAIRLHLVVGPEGAAQTREYNASMRDVGLIGKSVEIQMGNQLLPVMTKLGKFMGEEGPAMGEVFATILEAIGFAASALWLTLKDIGDSIGALAAQAAAVLSGDFEGAKAIGKMRDEEAAKNEAAYERLKANYGKIEKLPVAGLTVDPDPTVTDFSKDGKDPKDKSELPKFKAQLDSKIQAELGYFRDSTRLEIDFWTAKKNLSTTSAEDKAKIAHTIFELNKKQAQEHLAVELDTIKREMAAVTEAGAERVRLSHEAAIKIGENYGLESKEYTAAMAQVQAEMIAAEARRVELAKLSSTIVMESKLAELEFERDAIDQSFAMGETNNSQRLASLKKLEEKKFQIEQQAALDAAKLIHDDVLAQTKAYADIEKAKKAHELAMKKLDDQVALEKHKNQLKFVDETTNGFKNALAGMLNGTMTFGNAIRSIFASIGQSLTGIFADIAAKWIEKNIIMKVASAAFAKLEIMNAGAKAAANGTASMAGAPWPMDMTAPAFGASMGSLAGSFSVASAAGGFDIPSGTNPLTQLHEREMVLPAKHADVIRGMAGGGVGSGNHYWNGTGGDFINKRDLAKYLRTMNRNFVPLKP